MIAGSTKVAMCETSPRIFPSQMTMTLSQRAFAARRSDALARVITARQYAARDVARCPAPAPLLAQEVAASRARSYSASPAGGLTGVHGCTTTSSRMRTRGHAPETARKSRSLLDAPDPASHASWRSRAATASSMEDRMLSHISRSGLQFLHRQPACSMSIEICMDGKIPYPSTC